MPDAQPAATTPTNTGSPFPTQAFGDLQSLLKQAVDPKMLQDYATRLNQVGQQQKSALSQGIAQRNALVGRLRNATAQAPQLAQLQRMPSAPTAELSDSINVFGSVAPWLAIFGSLLTRAPLTSAMNAAASAMQGYHKGQQAVIENNFDKWKASTEEALGNNRNEIAQYQAARDKYGDKIDELKSELSVIAANNKDKIAMTMIDSGNLDQLYGPNGLLIKRMEAGAKIGEVLNKMNQFGILSDDTLDAMAGQYLAGDKSVFQNLGRGAQGAQNVVRLREKITQRMYAEGKTPSQVAAKIAEFSGLVSGERTLGTRSANIEMAVSEAKNMMPIALEASNNVDRWKYPSLNSVLLAVARGTGDESVVRLASATNALINIYARAISPTGVPTVSDKDHAREILDAAWSKGQYAAGVDQMWKEMQAAEKAPGQVRDELRGAITGEPSTPASSGGNTIFLNGQIYEDAKGHKAKYQDGQWLPQ